MYKQPRIIIIIGVVLALVLLACEPATKASPVDGRVALAGNSVAWQGLLYGDGTMSSYDVEDKLWPGWRAADALPRVTQDVAGPGTSPAVLVIEFGHNYAAWGQAQKNELAALVAAPHPDTCVVLVKPHPGPGNAAVIHGYRTSVNGLVTARPNTVSVDLTPLFTAHPEYLQADGVHLNVPPWDYGIPPQEPAVALSHLIAGGVASCP